MNWKVFIALMLLPAAVMAQAVPPIESIPPGEDKILPLKKGEEAPFAGQLFSPATSIRWANWMRQYKYRLRWDLEKERAVCLANTTYQASLLKAEEARASRVEKDLRVRLGRSEKARLKAEQHLRNPPWHTTRAFGTALGVAATVVIFSVSVWAVDASTK